MTGSLTPKAACPYVAPVAEWLSTDCCQSSAALLTAQYCPDRLQREEEQCLILTVLKALRVAACVCPSAGRFLSFDSWASLAVLGAASSVACWASARLGCT